MKDKEKLKMKEKGSYIKQDKNGTYLHYYSGGKWHKCVYQAIC